MYVTKYKIIVKWKKKDTEEYIGYAVYALRLWMNA